MSSTGEAFSKRSTSFTDILFLDVPAGLSIFSPIPQDLSCVWLDLCDCCRRGPCSWVHPCQCCEKRICERCSFIHDHPPCFRRCQSGLSCRFSRPQSTSEWSCEPCVARHWRSRSDELSVSRSPSPIFPSLYASPGPAFVDFLKRAEGNFFLPFSLLFLTWVFQDAITVDLETDALIDPPPLVLPKVIAALPGVVASLKCTHSSDQIEQDYRTTLDQHKEDLHYRISFLKDVLEQVSAPSHVDLALDWSVPPFFHTHPASCRSVSPTFSFKNNIWLICLFLDPSRTWVDRSGGFFYYFYHMHHAPQIYLFQFLNGVILKKFSSMMRIFI